MIPDWLGAAVVGGFVATLGFVAKHVFDWVMEIRKLRDDRRARLLSLASILRAGRTLYEVQNIQAKRLATDLSKNHPGKCRGLVGMEAIMSGVYDEMTADEKERHAIIRSTTIFGMRQLNESLLDWIRTDTTYRTSRARSGAARELAVALHQLETHLLIWQSKYSAWIPENPRHALVYLGDEKEHGPSFPESVGELVEAALR
jgi:hypothetical protein